MEQEVKQVSPVERGEEPRYRAAAEADIPAILALFEEVFGVARSEARFRWQYFDSPGGPGVTTLAETDAGIVGFVGQMRQDVNHMGSRVPAAQGCDSLMAVSHRGRGRYSRMADAAYALSRDAGIVLVCGFPNQAAFPVTIGDLGHERLLALAYYYRRIGIRQLDLPGLRGFTRLLGRFQNSMGMAMVRRRLGRNLTYSVTREVPADLGRMLRGVHHREVLSVYKDTAYLRWRYERHPEWQYTFHVLREDGRPVTAAVVREPGQVASICELFNPDRSTLEAAMLLRHIVSWYSTKGECKSVDFCGYDLGFFDTAFREAGFHAESYSSFVMTVRGVPGTSDPSHQRATHRANWTVTYGDTDVV